MKRLFILLCLFLFTHTLHAQDTALQARRNEVADQIKKERDQQLLALNENLKRNEDEVARLKTDLNSIKSADVQGRLQKMEALQEAQEHRLLLLENARKTRVSLNGQLAFTELLSVQRDIQPADLFLASKSFFAELGQVANLNQYPEFSAWKKEYDAWYAKKKGSSEMMEHINRSVKLISDVSAKIPLYGSVVNTVSSGIMPLLSSVGGASKKLVKATPPMLAVLNAVSQFESQKSIIDHEWASINELLEGLQLEHTALVLDQLKYYGLSRSDFEEDYLKVTMDKDRDEYKNRSRQAITRRMEELDAAAATKGAWMGRVETYMYKVQSIRLRFGQLTLRMKANIHRYETLMKTFSESKDFPPAFTENVKSLNRSLAAVSSKFQTYFNPARYIEDSAVMYIQ